MIKAFNINVNVGKKSLGNDFAFTVNTNDLNSVELTIKITKDFKPINLHGLTIRLATRKQRSEGYFWRNCTVKSAVTGVVTVSLDPSAYSLPGQYEGEVMLYRGEQQIAVSERFTYQSIGGIMDQYIDGTDLVLGPVTEKLIEIEEIIEDLRNTGTAIDVTARNSIEVISGELASKAKATDLTTGLATKVDTATFNTEVGKKADKTYVDTGLNGKVGTTTFQTEIAKKVDKTQFDSEMANKVNATNLNTLLSAKADKTEVDNKLLAKADSATVANSLGTKADKTYVDTGLSAKANTTDVTTAVDKKADKTYVDSVVGAKADTATMTTELGKKADTAYVDSSLTNLAVASIVETALNKKADKTYVDSGLAAKVSETTMTAELVKKADLSFVNTSLAAKANTTTVTTELAKKADLTYVDSSLAEKATNASVTEGLNKKVDKVALTVSLDAKADKTTVATELNRKADISYVDSAIAAIPPPAQSGVQMSDITPLLEVKADKTYTDTELGKKATATQVNAKADKTYVDTELGKKVDVTAHNTAMAGKVDTATYTTGLGTKVNTTTYNAGLAAKVDTTTYTAGLATKVDVTTFNTEVAKKSDKTYVDSQVANLSVEVASIDPNNVLQRLSVIDGQLCFDGVPFGAGTAPSPGGPTVYNGFAKIGKWFEEIVGSETVYSTHFPGASIKGIISGTTSITANFLYTGRGWTEAPIFAYRINGGSWIRKVMADTVLIQSGLDSAASYEVEIVFDGSNQTDHLWNNKRKFTIKNFTLDSGASITFSNTKKNVLIIGDSITAGTRTLAGGDAAAASSSVASYARKLTDAMNANLYASAFAGDKISHATGSFGLVTTGVTANYDIHTVVIAIGTNNYTTAEADFLTEYRALIAAVRAKYPTQRIYIVGLFETSASIRRNGQLAQLASESTGVSHIDTTALTGVTMGPDGLHPTEAGGTVIKDFLYAKLVADGWENGGGQTVPEPEIPSAPSGNVWALAGKPTSYNPITSNFEIIPFPSTFAGFSYKVSFNASSASSAPVNIYTANKGDFNQSVTLTPTLTPYTLTFACTYTGDNNEFVLNPSNTTDIIISDFKVEKI